MVAIHPLIVLGIGYTAGVLFFFARGLKPGARTTAFVLLAAIVLGSAMGLEARSWPVRYVVTALVLIIFLLHMWDLHMDPGRKSRLTLWAYVVFLGDYAWSVARADTDYGIGLPFKQRAIDSASYVAGFCLVTAVGVGIFKVDWAGYPFLLEHAAKSTAVLAWHIGAFQANTALWRLAGAPAAYFTTRSVLRAYSPAEFWRRWNRPMYRWLLENIYKPMGGRRHPMLATMAAFAVSGLFHEYIFGVALQHVTGYPTAFFLLQGLATVLTRRFKPTGWVRLPAILLTLAFMTASTILLFIPVGDQLPFYVNEVPKWARLW